MNVTPTRLDVRVEDADYSQRGNLHVPLPEGVAYQPCPHARLTLVVRGSTLQVSARDKGERLQDVLAQHAPLAIFLSPGDGGPWTTIGLRPAKRTKPEPLSSEDEEE